MIGRKYPGSFCQLTPCLAFNAVLSLLVFVLYGILTIPTSTMAPHKLCMIPGKQTWIHKVFDSNNDSLIYNNSLFQALSSSTKMFSLPWALLPPLTLIPTSSLSLVNLSRWSVRSFSLKRLNLSLFLVLALWVGTWWSTWLKLVMKFSLSTLVTLVITLLNGMLCRTKWCWFSICMQVG